MASTPAVCRGAHACCPPCAASPRERSLSARPPARRRAPRPRVRAPATVCALAAVRVLAVRASATVCALAAVRPSGPPSARTSPSRLHAPQPSRAPPPLAIELVKKVFVKMLVLGWGVGIISPYKKSRRRPPKRGQNPPPGRPDGARGGGTGWGDGWRCSEESMAARGC
jgi:hypothetical protein